MKLNVEIIPAVISNLTPCVINQYLKYKGIFTDPVGNIINDNTVINLEGFCKIHYRDNIYQLFKHDFEYVDPAIEYIEGYNIFNLDIKIIAKKWEAVGKSYEISTLQRVVSIEEKCLFLGFLEIVGAVAKVTGGNILIEEYCGYNKVGLYDSGSWSELIEKYGA